MISGGQTGVDRAALDAALESGLTIGGWCPRGRRAENGCIPVRYPLQETESRSYAVRTEWNVRDSDGTLVLVLGELSGGTRMTVDAARALGRPLHIEHLVPESRRPLPGVGNPESDPVQFVVEWLRRHKIRTLNVAGPRGSSSRLVYPRAKAFLRRVFACWLAEPASPVNSARK